MASRRLLALVGVTAVVTALAVAPAASAATVPSTVLLHDLYENGAYVGCHVTNPSFASYRATVSEGDRVVLTVQAPANNTNAHYLTVEGVDGKSGVVSAGGSTTFEFDATGTGSRGVYCDGQPSHLQGVLVVKSAGASDGATDGGNDTPAPGALLAGLALAGAAAVVGARRRG